MTLVRTATLLLATASSVGASEWPHFRGPFYNGSTDEKELPSSWSTTEDDGISWEAELPGPSAATPIIWKERVFISSSDPDADTLKAMCFDRRNGDLRWEHDVSEGIRWEGSRSNYASPSPVTDGERVVFFYGKGDLAAFDLDGKEIWKRDITEDYGEFAFNWTFASTPLLYGGKLYLQVLQRDVPIRGRGFRDRENESYLLALDPRTGEELWRRIRPSKAVAESREAFTSPIPFEGEERDVILVAGGDALTAHDPGTGKEIWRWGTWNPTRIGHWRLVPSPVAGTGIVLACAPKGDPVYAIKTGGSGTLGSDAIAWVSRESRAISSDVPTPAFYDGDFFVLNDKRKFLSRVEPRTGKAKWSVRTPGFPKYEASPLAGDGRIYIINFKGQVAVFDAESGELLDTIAHDTTGEYPIRSTIAAAHGQLFIRLNRRLICVGKN